MSGGFAIVAVLVGGAMYAAGAVVCGAAWLTFQAAKLAYKGAAKAAGFCGRIAVQHALPASRAGLARLRECAVARREVASDSTLVRLTERRVVRAVDARTAAVVALPLSNPRAGRPRSDVVAVASEMTRDQVSPLRTAARDEGLVLVVPDAGATGYPSLVHCVPEHSVSRVEVHVVPADAVVASGIEGSLAALAASRDALIEAAEAVALADGYGLPDSDALGRSLDSLCAALETGEEPGLVLAGARDILADALELIEAHETEEQADVLRRIGLRKEVRLLMETLRDLGYSGIRIASRDLSTGRTTIKAVPSGGRRNVTAIVDVDGSAFFDTRGAFVGRACEQAMEAVRRDFIDRLGIDVRLDEMTEGSTGGGQTIAGHVNDLAASAAPRAMEGLR